jgi:hypothetical protein
MTTWRSNQTPDQSSTATMAAYMPRTLASRAAAEFDATAPTAARQPFVHNFAWSAETPEFALPHPIERRRPWFMRSSVLTFVGGGLVAAAAAGLFGARAGTHGTPVDTTRHGAPAPAHADAPANPAPTPATQPKPATTTHSVTASRGSSGSISHQTPQYSPSSSSAQHTNAQPWQNGNQQQWQSNHDSVSTPPTWNRNDYFYSFTHRRDHDDSSWTRDHDSDDRSSSDRGDNSRSNDQSINNHSTGSNDNGSK